MTTRRRQPMGRLHRDDPQRYEREGVAMDAPSQSPDRPSGQKPVLVGSWRHRVWSASSPGSVPPAARRARHAVPRGQLAVRGGDRAPRRGGRLRRGRRPGGAPAAAPQGMEPRHLSHRPALHVGRRPVTAYASATLGVGSCRSRRSGPSPWRVVSERRSCAWSTACWARPSPGRPRRDPGRPDGPAPAGSHCGEPPG